MLRLRSVNREITMHVNVVDKVKREKTRSSVLFGTHTLQCISGPACISNARGQIEFLQDTIDIW